MRTAFTTGFLAISAACLAAFASSSCESESRTPLKPEIAAACKNFPKKGRIDEILIAKLAKDGVAPAELCDDATFLRRVHLDAAGSIPGAEEAKAFLDSQDPLKREKLVDRLLESKDFAACQAMKWGDALRVKAEFPSNLWPNAAKVYSEWLRDCVAKDMPYDQFVRAILVSSGSNFHKPPVNFYRAFQERTPQRIAENVALVFMGTRLESPCYDDARRLGMAAFFAKIASKRTDEWKEEIIFFDPSLKGLSDPRSGAAVKPCALDGKTFELDEESDPREVFASWLTSPKNPWFAKNAVNRIWASLMGRGLIEEADDIRPDNPPWSPELLAHLELELVSSGWSRKHVYAEIMKSSCYQMASAPSKLNKDEDAAFSRCKPRRLEAELLVDALCQATGSSEKYSSGIPEPFTFLPDGTRAVEIEDGSISSPMLELFGRPSRNSSLLSERSNASSVLQAQFLLNSNSVQRKIERGPSIRRIVDAKAEQSATIEALYLQILSRRPSAEERSTAAAYMSDSKRKRNDAALDVAWALLNSKEFVLRR